MQYEDALITATVASCPLIPTICSSISAVSAPSAMLQVLCSNLWPCGWNYYPVNDSEHVACASQIVCSKTKAQHFHSARHAVTLLSACLYILSHSRQLFLFQRALLMLCPIHTGWFIIQRVLLSFFTKRCSNILLRIILNWYVIEGKWSSFLNKKKRTSMICNTSGFRF